MFFLSVLCAAAMRTLLLRLGLSLNELVTSVFHCRRCFPRVHTSPFPLRQSKLLVLSQVVASAPKSTWNLAIVQVFSCHLAPGLFCMKCCFLLLCVSFGVEPGQTNQAENLEKGEMKVTSSSETN
jgi:hypothetical protein